MGDFNHCKPGKTLCSFEQYVTCSTRLTNCLDLCYGSVKGAYKSLQRAPLGTSDTTRECLIRREVPLSVYFRVLNCCSSPLVPCEGAHMAIAPSGALVELQPEFVLRKHKPERKIVPVWSRDSIQRLQDCFSLTDWDLFVDVSRLG
ncbi:hypothetical protein N1851_000123 [Merluccius polli]|uniref:Uncharacterized protein n=1 Tax=Merluccius polli TaxID=89951 RepID=A0AA47NEI9_MERPO|nr:hypothetical protein N1851_000123 [Merluccius polli]